MHQQDNAQQPVVPSQLLPARHFAANFVGENIAGTDFIIGALFVTWGVGTGDLLLGLLLGNLLAILSWVLICTPIAVATRLTPYAYLEKIAGPGIVKVYGAISGILFCILAGTMITIAAVAVPALLTAPPQITWYPSSLIFVGAALAIGATVASIAMHGFKSVAIVAEICAPWLVLVFFTGTLSLVPQLIDSTPGINSIESFPDFLAVANTHIWVDKGSGLGMLHVAAFTWICNLVLHGGLADMSVLRFARRSSYGYYSALGLLIGHYAVWVGAGIMGAGAALALQTSVTILAAGEVAYTALGTTGIIAVVIASITTSSPALYRAGLAFQSMHHSWHRDTVTLVAGAMITLIACFPLVFPSLINRFVLIGMVLSPVGAVIVAEHWIFPRIGLTRYWSSYAGRTINWAVVIAWTSSLAVGFILTSAGLDWFFLLLPIWVVAMAVYVIVAGILGATQSHEQLASDYGRRERERKKGELAFLQQQASCSPQQTRGGRISHFLVKWFALAGLGLGVALAVSATVGAIPWETCHRYLLWGSLCHLPLAALWAVSRERIDLLPRASIDHHFPES